MNFVLVATIFSFLTQVGYVGVLKFEAFGLTHCQVRYGGFLGFLKTNAQQSLLFSAPFSSQNRNPGHFEVSTIRWSRKLHACKSPEGLFILGTSRNTFVVIFRPVSRES